MFQMGGVGPMVGQLGHFYKFAADKITDSYPTDRYVAETKRLLNMLNRRLAGRDYIMGDDFTIADIATFPWIQRNNRHQVDLDDFPNVKQWYDELSKRPAVEKGMAVPFYNE